MKSLCGVGSWGWDYDQRGLVCAIETAEPHTTAWQRFLSTGPLAMLPVLCGVPACAIPLPRNAHLLCCNDA